MTRLSLWDERDEDGRPYFDFHHAAVPRDPLSIRQLANQLVRARAEYSGSARDKITREAEAALKSFHCSAERLYGVEMAVVLTLGVVARDQSYRPARWLAEALEEHRDACEEVYREPAKPADYDQEAWAHSPSGERQPASAKKPVAARRVHPWVIRRRPST